MSAVRYRIRLPVNSRGRAVCTTLRYPCADRAPGLCGGLPLSAGAEINAARAKYVTGLMRLRVLGYGWQVTAVG